MLRTFVAMVEKVMEEEAAVGGSSATQTPEERRKQADENGLVGEGTEECP
ncbi:MAG: hypothetical protein Q7J66_21320 [Hydrogenophaga sp.]|nr:hypothetical protein [Hydrogenophaga sp.]